MPLKDSPDTQVKETETHTHLPEYYEPVSAAVAQLPLRRNLTESLPPTPANFDFDHFPPTIEAVKALLPPTLAARFQQEIEQTPFQRLSDLVMDWGQAAVCLHEDGVQQSLELIEDGDKEGLKVIFSPLPNWDEEDTQKNGTRH